MILKLKNDKENVMKDRSSLPEVLCKIVIQKNFA